MKRRVKLKFALKKKKERERADWMVHNGDKMTQYMQAKWS